MVKIIFCLRRQAHLSPQAFQDYWRMQHGPKVVERARMLGIRRYVQSHTLFDPRLGGLAAQRGTLEAPFDGVAELWFDAEEVLHPHADVPPAIAQAGLDLLDDERTFIDLARSPIFVVREHEILAPTPHTS